MKEVIKINTFKDLTDGSGDLKEMAEAYLKDNICSLAGLSRIEDRLGYKRSPLCLVEIKYSKDCFYTIGYLLKGQILGSIFGSYDKNAMLNIIAYGIERFQYETKTEFDRELCLIQGYTGEASYNMLQEDKIIQPFSVGGYGKSKYYNMHVYSKSI